MSRIGKKPVAIRPNVEVTVSGSVVSVKGPAGALSQELPDGISVEVVEKPEPHVVVKRSGDHRALRALHGLCRALIANMIVGVTDGHRKSLSIIGKGYRAEESGKNLLLHLGYAKPVSIPIPEGVKVRLPNPQAIAVSGPDKQAVGQFAAAVRAARPPDPYKNKGVKYSDEVLRKLPGKSFASVG